MLEDDRDLMCRFMRTGNAQSLAALYHRHHACLRRFLHRLTREPALADDLAQQTWLKLMDAAANGRYVAADASFKAFLYTVARNTFLDECTRKHAVARRQTLSDTQFEQAVNAQGEQHTPEAQAQHSQSRSLLRMALASLPVEQQDVLRWWVSGASIVAMSRSAQAPRDTVLSR